MRHTILAGLAALILAAPLQAQAPTSAGDYAFEYVCDVLEQDCSNLSAPKIEYAHLIQLQRWYGYFWPTKHAEDTVFMDISFRSALESGDITNNKLGWSVLVHEVSHYVDYHNELTAGSCATESLAFFVSNVWALEHQLRPRWRWYDSYSQCTWRDDTWGDK